MSSLIKLPDPMIFRQYKLPLIKPYTMLIIWLAIAWCVMTISHESGHIMGGWCSGATLVSWELRPWRIPYSLFSPNPKPLITLWAGPLLGVIIPLAVALMVRKPWSWFLAHFCLLANGCYLLAAWWSNEASLDTPRLLAAGASPLSIAIYCTATTAVGYLGFRRCCMELLTVPTRRDSQVNESDTSD